MNDLLISGTSWRNPDNVWDDLLEALGAPDWHGRNLDALSDSVCTGSVNAIQPPLRVLIRDVANIPGSTAFLLYRMQTLFEELAAQGTAVEMVFPEGEPQGWGYVTRRDAFRHLRTLDVLREWDPIGVYGPGSSCPDNEYDSYAPGVIKLLERGAS
ncbi:MAG TPA: barstar family protein, partial [Phycisphaerae bacterium]|nr:barstar family protein [Phycisphaerae bacterium]